MCVSMRAVLCVLQNGRAWRVCSEMHAVGGLSRLYLPLTSGCVAPPRRPQDAHCLEGPSRSMDRFCSPAACARFETQGHCAFQLGLGAWPNRSCSMVDAELKSRYNMFNCTVCSVPRRLHVISPATLTFPASSQAFACGSHAGVLRPPTSLERLEHATTVQSALKRVLDACSPMMLPSHKLVGTPHVPAFPAGFGTLLHGACSMDAGARSSFDVQLDTRTATRGRHNVVISGSVLHEGNATAAVVRFPAKFWELSRHRDEARSYAVPCVLSRNSSCSLATQAALQRQCSNAHKRDMASHRALSVQGVPGWPTIYSLGCAAYQYNGTHVLLLPFDVRHKLSMDTAGAFWSKRTRFRRAAMPAACTHLNLADTHCILRALALGATMLSLLTEAPFRYRLKEHTMIPAHTELKLGGSSGQFGHDPDTGQIAFADTDHAYEVDGPAGTATEQLSPGHRMQDLVLAFSNSVIRPAAEHALNGSLPQLRDLVVEIARRNDALRVGLPPGVNSVQMSFSCVSAWIRALAGTVSAGSGLSAWPASHTNDDRLDRILPASMAGTRPANAPAADIFQVTVDE